MGLPEATGTVAGGRPSRPRGGPGPRAAKPRRGGSPPPARAPPRGGRGEEPTAAEAAAGATEGGEERAKATKGDHREPKEPRPTATRAAARPTEGPQTAPRRGRRKQKNRQRGPQQRPAARRPRARTRPEEPQRGPPRAPKGDPDEAAARGAHGPGGGKARPGATGASRRGPARRTRGPRLGWAGGGAPEPTGNAGRRPTARERIPLLMAPTAPRKGGAMPDRVPHKKDRGAEGGHPPRQVISDLVR